MTYSGFSFDKSNESIFGKKTDNLFSWEKSDDSFSLGNLKKPVYTEEDRKLLDFQSEQATRGRIGMPVNDPMAAVGAGLKPETPHGMAGMCGYPAHVPRF